MPLFSHYGDVQDISDRLAIPSLVFSIVFSEAVSIQMIIVCHWAFGKHRIDVLRINEQILAKTLKLYFFAQICYKVNIGLTKISILLLYIKVFVQPWFRKICSICICIIIAFTTGTVFSSIFQCTPVQFAFNKKLPGGGHCINLTAFWYANAVFNIVSDVVIIMLPIPIVVKLHSPIKTRIAVSGVFAVGLFACITSVLRFTTLNVATSHHDTTWTNIASSMWTVIETNIGIICACMPTLWGPLSSLFPWLSSRVMSQKYATAQSLASRNPDLSRRRGSATSPDEGYWTKIGSSDEQLARDYQLYAGAEGERRATWVEDVRDEEENRGTIRKTTHVSVRYCEGDARNSPSGEITGIELKRVGNGR